ncbi:MAG: RidA family protein [Catenulispora sp.]
MDFTEITRLRPAGLVVSPAFSQVAVVPAGATTVYVGGQNGVDAEGEVVSDDVAEQAGRALDNAEVALAAAGATLADVVQWTVFIAQNADVRAAYGAIGPRLGAASAEAGAPPLVTAALVAALAVPGALIEISAVAALLPK